MLSTTSAVTTSAGRTSARPDDSTTSAGARRSISAAVWRSAAALAAPAAPVRPAATTRNAAAAIGRPGEAPAPATRRPIAFVIDGASTTTTVAPTIATRIGNQPAKSADRRPASPCNTTIANATDAKVPTVIARRREACDTRARTVIVSTAAVSQNEVSSATGVRSRTTHCGTPAVRAIEGIASIAPTDPTTNPATVVSNASAATNTTSAPRPAEREARSHCVSRDDARRARAASTANPSPVATDAPPTTRSRLAVWFARCWATTRPASGAVTNMSRSSDRIRQSRK